MTELLKNKRLNVDYIDDLNISQINAEPPRAYYVPYSSAEKTCGRVTNYYDDRRNSDEYVSLNGVWKFKKYDSLYEADGFLSDEYPDEIPVPSCVQYFGYDIPQYSGAATTFAFMPPYVPKENPVFCYRRTLDYDKKQGRKQYIVFEGADSCLWLYVNKKFVGYAEISHADHEFDLTDFLTNGENVIDVAVAKLCKGSYLELQDKWRFSGLFRDVYILDRPEKHIVDYKIYSKFDYKDNADFENSEIKEVKVIFEYLRGDVDIEVSMDGSVKKLAQGEKCEFKLTSARLWTAETPELYNIVIEGGGEKICENFAVRDIRIVNRVVYINGKKIKFRGANRHEFMPKSGATVSIEQTADDLVLLKKFNFNAIRTSHYPDIPEFYRLCDRFGVYVVSEADIECHGAVKIEGGYEEEYFKLLSDNPAWQKAYLDRTETMYERDKNRGCIVFWSLGNESGYGCNQEACAKYLISVDGNNRLIHYEGIQCRRDHKTEVNEDVYYTDLLSVVSRMYPSVEYMKEKCLNDPREHRPLFLCEYAHSMGNGPGGLEDYQRLIESDDRIAGAFVWEWADHGIDFGDGKYRYGSDFKVDFSDGNFCIDGAFGPNREIKSAALAFKATNQPIKIQRIDNSGAKFNLINRYDFISLDAIDLIVEFKKGGNVVKTLSPNVKNIPPHGSKTIDLTCEYNEILSSVDSDKTNPDNFINVIFKGFTNKSTDIIPKGHCLVESAFTLNDVYGVKAEGVADAKIIKSAARETVVQSVDTLYVFDNFTGELKYIQTGEDKIELKLNPQILRADLDNDVNNAKKWDAAGLYNAKPTAIKAEFLAENDGSESVLVVSGAFTRCIYRPCVYYTMSYKFYGKSFSVKLQGNVTDDVEFLPRFGITFNLPEKYSTYKYLGFGPRESYVDKNQHTRKDFFTSSVKNDYESYIKPQESTSHVYSSYLNVLSDDAECEIKSNKLFSFSVVPYSVKELTEAKHDYDLLNSDKSVVSLDYMMSGVGSESCGPALDEEYKMKEKHPEITFVLKF